MPGSELKPEDATFGIITALAHEFVAAQVVFGSTEVAVVDRPGSGRAYYLACVPSLGGGQHIVAITQLADMGNTAAAIRVTNLLTDCSSIKYVIMVGIAGAVPDPRDASKHVRLGDVVVCDLTGIVQYDFGALKPSGIVPKERPRSPAISLIDAHKRLQVRGLKGERPWEESLTATIESLGSQWARPSLEKDRLCEGRLRRLLRRPVPHPVDSLRIEGLPRVFHGRIGSANVVLKDRKKRNQLRAEHGVLAVEMEAAGVADAVSHAESSFFVVRGTCDYCNEDKNDDWQFYAAAAAAAYARALVEEVPRVVSVPPDPNPPVRSLPEHTATPALPKPDTSPHVFISYVREDEERVRRICDALERANIRVWRDRSQLIPGQRWRPRIRRAIEGGDFFLACFSTAYHERDSTCMNEELTLAIDVMRQLSTERVWFIPLLLDDCAVPDREIGGGARLTDLQHVQYHSDPDGAIRAIIKSILGAEATTVSVGTSAASTPPAKVDGAPKTPEVGSELSAELRDLRASVKELASRLVPGAGTQAVGPGDAQRLLDAVNRHLKVFETEEAIEFLPLLTGWLHVHEEQLDKSSIREICLMIAELEVLRHKGAKSRGEESSLRVAREFIEKAQSNQ